MLQLEIVNYYRIIIKWFMPVISSIGIDDEGRLMNVNADQAAVALFISLNADLALHYRILINYFR